jgi:hypothetical protein
MIIIKFVFEILSTHIWQVLVFTCIEEFIEALFIFSVFARVRTYFDVFLSVVMADCMI